MAWERVGVAGGARELEAGGGDDFGEVFFFVTLDGDGALGGERARRGETGATGEEIVATGATGAAIGAAVAEAGVAVIAGASETSGAL